MHKNFIKFNPKIEETEGSSQKERKSKQVGKQATNKEKGEKKKKRRRSCEDGEIPEPKPAILMEAVVTLQRWTNYLKD